MSVCVFSERLPWLCCDFLFQMLFQMDADNSVMKWLLRVGGWLMTWIGLQMFLGPIAVLPDVVPCIGPMRNYSTQSKPAGLSARLRHAEVFL